MIRIGIIGDIGSGKSFVAKNFGYPVFDADYEVSKIYKKDKKTFKKLNKNLPKYIYSFPINKKEITNAILKKKSNLKLIVKIIHKEIRKKFQLFLNKNKKIKAGETVTTECYPLCGRMIGTVEEKLKRLQESKQPFGR